MAKNLILMDEENTGCNWRLLKDDKILQAQKELDRTTGEIAGPAIHIMLERDRQVKCLTQELALAQQQLIEVQASNANWRAVFADMGVASPLSELSQEVVVDPVSREEALRVGENWESFANSTALMKTGQSSPFLAYVGSYLHHASEEELTTIKAAFPDMWSRFDCELDENGRLVADES